MPDKILTFIDSGVLITAARGIDTKALKAFAFLDDPDRAFVSSIFIKLELLPKATYNKQRDEEAFYNAFFAAVTVWAEPAAIVEPAFTAACLHGLAALDSLHIAAALISGATEFITTERSEKPLHRVKDLRIITL
jgi:predicted nucleic acid-binding protein